MTDEPGTNRIYFRLNNRRANRLVRETASALEQGNDDDLMMYDEDVTKIEKAEELCPELEFGHVSEVVNGYLEGSEEYSPDEILEDLEDITSY